MPDISKISLGNDLAATGTIEPEKVARESISILLQVELEPHSRLGSLRSEPIRL